MMEILKNQTRDILTAWFPSCHVQFETLGEDPNVIGVGVYGVPKPLVKWVKKKIHELDGRFFADAGYVLLPLVRDWETTCKFYPHLVRQWRPTAVEVFSSTIDMAIGDPALEGYGPRRPLGTWRLPSSRSSACNEEMALAA